MRSTITQAAEAVSTRASSFYHNGGSLSDAGSALYEAGRSLVNTQLTPKPLVEFYIKCINYKGFVALVGGIAALALINGALKAGVVTRKEVKNYFAEQKKIGDAAARYAKEHDGEVDPKAKTISWHARITDQYYGYNYARNFSALWTYPKAHRAQTTVLAVGIVSAIAFVVASTREMSTEFKTAALVGMAASYYLPSFINWVGTKVGEVASTKPAAQKGVALEGIQLRALKIALGVPNTHELPANDEMILKAVQSTMDGIKTLLKNITVVQDTQSAGAVVDLKILHTLLEENAFFDRYQIAEDTGKVVLNSRYAAR